MADLTQHSTADIIQQLLIDLGQGTDPVLNQSWPVYAEDLPDSPDNVLITYETAGKRDGRTMPDGEVQLHLGVKLRVRSTTHPVGFPKAQAVCNVLDGLHNRIVVLEGVTYRIQCLNRQGQVLAMGFDYGTHRRLFDVNYQCVILTL